MKPNDIHVGKTYRNKGGGNTARTVLAITGPGNGAERLVKYRQIGGPWDQHEFTLWLPGFAKWAGSEVA